WVLAWAAHALETDPAAVLHGNAFHPVPWSLALSEHMLGNQPLFAPVYLATGNPVLAYQWTLLASFVLAGLTMSAWGLHHTNDRAAAFVAGLLYAFAPFRMWQLGSLHVISTQWVPLVPLGIDLALDGRGPLGATVLGLGLTLSTGCSYYTGYVAFALGASYGAGAWLTRRVSWRRVLWPVAAAAAAAAVMAAGGFPYLILQDPGVMP